MNESIIGAINGDEYELRGTSIVELMRSSDFISAAWLAWTGECPDEHQKRMIEACFVASVDHGSEPPSAVATREAAKAGKPLAASVAAGMLAIGPRHGNAAGPAADWVREAVGKGTAPSDIVETALNEKARIPGLGHRIYEVDPRTQTLLGLANEHLGGSRHLLYMQEVAAILSEKKGKRMPVNVDGAIGAIIADMGAESWVADAIFLSARAAGLAAHAHQEATETPSSQSVNT